MLYLLSTIPGKEVLGLFPTTRRLYLEEGGIPSTGPEGFAGKKMSQLLNRLATVKKMKDNIRKVKERGDSFQSKVGIGRKAGEEHRPL